VSAQNPDFSLESKKLIARATRKVLGMPDDNRTVERPKNQRGGLGGGEPPPEIAGQIRVAGANGKAAWSAAPLVELD
jgi:hypothetical protein